MLVSNGGEETYLSKSSMQRGEDMSNIDQVENMVDRQINLIAQLDNEFQIDYMVSLSGGFLSGMAGAYMSMGYMKFFVRGMVAGRGFVGLAANNVGGRHPIGAFLASALFGVFESLANNLQSIVTIPVEFIQMIPYITTILAYTFFSYRKMTERQRKAKKLATSNN